MAARNASIAERWVQVVNHGFKTSSLKFALARVLLDEAERGDGAAFEVTLEQLAERMLETYWLQIVWFRLREHEDPMFKSLVVRRLETLRDGGQVPRDPARLPTETRADLLAAITDTGLDQVLRRFNNVRGGTSAGLYERHRGKILVATDVSTFLAGGYSALRDALLFRWTLWLEEKNPTAPRIGNKVNARIGERRTSNTKARALFLAEEVQCFYCARTDCVDWHVDHVIPWNYLCDNALWNLVLACDRCNLSKSDSLPDDEFVSRLIDRNTRLSRTPTILGGKLAQSMQEIPGDEPHAGINRLVRNAMADGFPFGWRPRIEAAKASA